MTNRHDWNYERYRTRDRLLEYGDTLNMPTPTQKNISVIYPWENISLAHLSNQILELAKKHGYQGTEESLWAKFSQGNVITGTLDTFPIPGDENNLYLDLETEILYYFKSATSIINNDLAGIVGVAIVGTSVAADTEGNIKHLYIPIRALPIENLIIDCGSAAEYID